MTREDLERRLEEELDDFLTYTNYSDDPIYRDTFEAMARDEYTHACALQHILGFTSNPNIKAKWQKVYSALGLD